MAAVGAIWRMTGRAPGQASTPTARRGPLPAPCVAEVAEARDLGQVGADVLDRPGGEAGLLPDEAAEGRARDEHGGDRDQDAELAEHRRTTATSAPSAAAAPKKARNQPARMVSRS